MPDYRLPEHRRETFLKFYQFHIKYKSHPGCVYYLMPYLAERFKWSIEEKLWFAYLNGNTQNPVTSWLIFRRYGSSKEFLEQNGEDWFNQSWNRLQWDTDRRYQKKDLVANIKWYDSVTRPEGQVAFFANLTDGARTEYEVFQKMWAACMKNFPSFGRLASFSYLEYLRIMGMRIECDNLFLDDIEGSKSHRNGLAIVSGHDELDWRKDNPVKYSKDDIEMLRRVGSNLLNEAAIRMPEERDVSYFTLESTLCTYKSWHRPNRRYPNVYNDMLHDRIKWAESKWEHNAVKVFWEAREACLPDCLRQECNDNDPGLTPAKQNYYREHGVPIMMSKDFPEFDNEFDRMVWS